MAWYDTIGQILAALPVDKAAEVLNGMNNSNEMVAQVNSMLYQVQRDPSSASQVATQIMAMKGVPGIVRDLAGGLPQAARDPSGTALTIQIAQIQSALPRSRWF